jgi:hypothetical protein
MKSPIEFINKVVPFNRSLSEFFGVIATNSDLRLFLKVSNLDREDLFINNFLIVKLVNQEFSSTFLRSG